LRANPGCFMVDKLRYLLQLLLIAGISSAAAFGQTTWTNPVGGNWNSKSNWSNKVPKKGDTATLGSVITADRTITLSQGSPITGNLVFDSSHTYTLSGNKGLRLDNKNSTSELNVLSSNAANQVIAADVQLNNALRINQESSALLTISGDIGVKNNPSLIITKEGSGRVLLSGNNTAWGGRLIIDDGAVRINNNNSLGSSTSGNEINSGGTLELTGGITVNEGNFNTSGTGTSGSGAIRNVSGSNTLDARVVLQSDASIRADAGTLTLADQINLGSNDLTFTGSGDFSSTNQVVGSGGITMDGTGTLTLGGSANSYSGDTFVNSGTVELNTSGLASGGNWVIGDGSGTDTLRLLAGGQLADYQDVTINSSGVLDLNGFNDTVDNVTMTGGLIETDGGTLTVGNSSPTFQVNASSTGSLVDGNLAVGQYNLDFDVADGSAADDLTIDGTFTAGTQWQKSGDGRMVLAGSTANAGTGNAIINGGTLELAKTDGTQALASNEITVNSGGTLLLGAENQINNNTDLDLAGGTFSTGETTGFEETLGQLTLSSNSTIDLGTGVHLLNFADSSSLNWAWSGLLTIEGWVGAAASSGTQGQIFFGNNSSGLTANQLNMIQFNGFGVGAILLGNGELVPVPEAEVILAVAFILLVVAWRERRPLAGLLARIVPSSTGSCIYRNRESTPPFTPSPTKTDMSPHKSNCACLALTFIAMIVIPSSAVGQIWSYEWDSTGGGSWDSGSNWDRSSSVFFFPAPSTPNSSQADVTLGNIITADRTITLGGTRSVNELTFNANRAYTLQGGTVDFASGFLTGNPELTIDDSAGTALHRINSNVSLSADLTVTQDSSQRFTINGSISGANDLTKAGAGRLVFDGTAANSYTGDTIINAGTLELSKTAGTNAIAGGDITINSGGTLLLDASNQIANGVDLELDGGTFDTDGNSEALGQLTLSSNSTIDLGTGVSLLNFANSSSTSALWSGLLTIENWVGDPWNPGTQGRIFFGNNSSGLTASQLNMIQFAGFGVGAHLLATGELVPVPEAEVLLAVLTVIGAVGWRERRRLRHLVERFGPLLRKP